MKVASTSTELSTKIIKDYYSLLSLKCVHRLTLNVALTHIENFPFLTLMYWHLVPKEFINNLKSEVWQI